MKHPLIKPTICFILGILTAFYSSINFNAVLAFTACILILFIIAFLRAKKLWLQDYFFGITAFLMLFCFGMIAKKLHAPENQPNHYLKFENSSEALLQLKIVEELKPSFYNKRFIAEVEALNARSTHGKIMLYLPNDSTSVNVKIDDKLWVFAALKDIQSALNPHQFNYKAFLSSKKVYKEIRLKNHQILSVKRNEKSARGIATQTRQKIISKLGSNSFEENQLAIIQALLLGERKDISKEVYEAYANAGAIHILAVSGLHVGIILWLLNIFLKPVRAIAHGRMLQLTIVVFLLWGYAILAGLSPSIIRAVTMFSFVAIGLQFRRKGNILNLVFGSLLILLIINPLFLFEIGFQLSYLAVISIILFQPIIYEFWEPKNKAAKYFWGILSVTIAAQLGVLPLSLYYFHQFPGLFFITNILLIPVLGIILGLGIIVTFLAFFDILPILLAKIFNYIIFGMNRVVSTIAQQEAFLFDEISFSKTQMLATYLIILSLYFFLKKFSARNLQLFLLSIIAFQLVLFYESEKSNNPEMLIFHKNKETIIGVKQNGVLTTFSTIESVDKQKVVRDYAIGENLQKFSHNELQNFYAFRNKKVFVIDSFGIYNVKSLQPDYILLSHSPKIHLERVLDSLNPKAVIADGSNYPSFVRLWEKTCKQKKTPFHHTGKTGAFIVE